MTQINTYVNEASIFLANFLVDIINRSKQPNRKLTVLKELQSSPSHVIKKIKSLIKFVSIETAVLVP